MPFALYLLALAVFVMGTSEFMLAGLLPAIATDLDVTVGTAGLLTAAFAIGMVVGAPLMAAFARRFPPRAALLVSLLVFGACHVIAALTPAFPVLLASRVLGALANAGFLAIAVDRDHSRARRPKGPRPCHPVVRHDNCHGRRSSSRCASGHGSRVACDLLGDSSVVRTCRHRDPAGHPGSIGCNDRDAAVSGRTQPTALPPSPARDGPRCTGERRHVRGIHLPGARRDGNSRIERRLGLAGACLVRRRIVPRRPVAGRLSDNKPGLVLAVGGPLLLAGWITLALLASYPAVLVTLVFVQGTLSFGVGSTLIAQVLYAAADAPTMGGAYATAALNVGAATGPVLGTLALATGAGALAPAWVAAALTALALVIVLLSQRHTLRWAGETADQPTVGG